MELRDRVAYVEKRYGEILAAFDEQAPPAEGEERYDVTTIALDVLASMKPGS